MDALSHPWICKGLPEELKNKLGSGSREFVKSRSKREGGSIPKFKSRPKEKASSSSKLTNKSSH